jgi:hypothetical protein
VVVLLSLRIGPDIFMNVPVREYYNFKSYIFRSGGVCYCNSVNITDFVLTGIPDFLLEISSLPSFAKKSANNTFISYIGNFLSSFHPYMVHAHSEQ